MKKKKQNYKKIIHENEQNKKEMKTKWNKRKMKK